MMDDVFGGTLTGAMLEEQTTWRDPYTRIYPWIDEYRSPWLYPTTPPEQPSVAQTSKVRSNPFANHPITASPHGRNADVRGLFDMVLGNPNLRDAFENAQTPGEADAAGQDVAPVATSGGRSELQRVSLLACNTGSQRRRSSAHDSMFLQHRLPRWSTGTSMPIAATAITAAGLEPPHGQDNQRP